MDSFDDVQIEEMVNFDHIADEDFLDVITEEFNMNDYINGNYDY